MMNYKIKNIIIVVAVFVFTACSTSGVAGLLSRNTFETVKADPELYEDGWTTPSQEIQEEFFNPRTEENNLDRIVSHLSKRKRKISPELAKKYYRSTINTYLAVFDYLYKGVGKAWAKNTELKDYAGTYFKSDMLVTALACHIFLDPKHSSRDFKKIESSYHNSVARTKIYLAANETMEGVFQVNVISNEGACRALKTYLSNYEGSKFSFDGDQEAPQLNGNNWGVRWRGFSSPDSVADYCGLIPFRMIFVNGMRTSYAEAVDSWYKARENLVDQSIEDEDIELAWQLHLDEPPTIAYNHDEGIGLGLLEAHLQKQKEVELHPKPDSVYEFTKVTEAIQKYSSLVFKILEDHHEPLRLDEPEMKNHVELYEAALKTSPYGLVLVAHSQGHLYANAVAHELKIRNPKVCDRMAILGVGGAGSLSECGGSNIVNNNDLITGPSGILSKIHSVRSTHTDSSHLTFLGHSFIEEYLASYELSSILFRVFKEKRTFLRAPENKRWLLGYRNYRLGNSWRSSLRDYFSSGLDLQGPVSKLAAVTSEYFDLRASDQLEEADQIASEFSNDLGFYSVVSALQQTSGTPCELRSIDKTKMCIRLSQDILSLMSKNNLDTSESMRLDQLIKERQENCADWVNIIDRPDQYIRQWVLPTPHPYLLELSGWYFAWTGSTEKEIKKVSDGILAKLETYENHPKIPQ